MMILAVLVLWVVLSIPVAIFLAAALATRGVQPMPPRAGQDAVGQDIAGQGVGDHVPVPGAAAS